MTHGQCRDRDVVACKVYAAVPGQLQALAEERVSVELQGDTIRLGNGYLSVAVSAVAGTVTSVTNRLTEETFSISGDQAGVSVRADGRAREWMVRGGTVRHFVAQVEASPEVCRVILSEKAEGFTFSVAYRLQRNHFWIERRVCVEHDGEYELDRIAYGKLHVEGADERVLELGKFDQPRLVTCGNGGLFAGVAWWFYSVDERGVYQNSDMGFAAQGRFESEPWYLGVLRAEHGEPYTGWLWYRSFLEQRKAEYDKQASWCYWNGGWGQWGIDVDDASAPRYLELAHRLGIRSFAFGGGLVGKGIPAYVGLIQESEVAKENIRQLRQDGIEFGFLDHAGLGDQWGDTDVVEDRLKLLDECAEAGISALHFDFFKTTDTFTAHHNVARYFRTAREKMSYTECHLGMAAYGPQFQREVLINHPNDLHGFDISHFSPDWATFLGFRHSRREWQQRYEYLMPECGLYYFSTHYSNWGHPKRYTDPEPQQFLYSPHAYCGIGFNFHDAFGYRDALVATAAFSPYLVLGHLDAEMPESDVDFTRDFLQWVGRNAAVLRPGRVCFEDEAVCVVSKVNGSTGAIFLLNYGPSGRLFRLTLDSQPDAPFGIRQVYPARAELGAVRRGAAFDVRVGGESVVILEVGDAFDGLPPENRRSPRIEIVDWRWEGDGWRSEFSVSDPSSGAQEAADQGLPTELSALDGSEEAVIGLGALPDEFLSAYGFSDNRAATWKFVPWVYTGRVWLVYRPNGPYLLIDAPPEARINGQGIKFVPRTDYRARRKDDLNVTAWTCPLFFADITDLIRYGASNELVLTSLRDEQPGACYIPLPSLPETTNA